MKDNVIDFARYATGKLIARSPQANGVGPSAGTAAARIIVDPEKDLIVGLAMKMLKAVEPEVADHPLKVLTSLNVVVTAIHEQFYRCYGEKEYQRMASTSMVASQLYKARFKDDDAPQSG